MYVQRAEPTDFQNVSGISFLPANFTIDEDNFSSITENSLVVLDDFSFKFPKMLGIQLQVRAGVGHQHQVQPAACQHPARHYPFEFQL